VRAAALRRIRTGERSVRSVLITIGLIKRLYQRQGGICPACGLGMIEWHVDHKVPLARGGRHEEQNLQLLHPRCNLSKGARLVH
jgi:5-methylcytosine-specific restriction endonuclease McrA